ncbi:DUF537-domain-containing protein [Leucogyrophana mollusca]|uniref:DUF537-domain-containing protein n=1 Tax=Leucogyrophana mollusca TaxID=85980 RepID=A0ACB8C032_9AGAM|nr:DUF537-domain-containing protein [Leucogyrophana mollusca]
MSENQDVAIFWDYENCSPPSSLLGYDIVNNIRRMAHVFGPVTNFKAYLGLSDQSAKSTALRSELQSSGVSLIDCPHNGRKDVADKMILVDMLAFAIDHPAPATIMLISGDRDYAYAVSTLRLRRYRVVLIVPPIVHPSLQAQASIIVDWSFGILGRRLDPITSPVRQPYLDLDSELVAQLSREVKESYDDSETTLVSSPPVATASRPRQVSARDLLQPHDFEAGAEENGKTDSVFRLARPAPLGEAAAFISPSHVRHTSEPAPSKSTSQAAQHTADAAGQAGDPGTFSVSVLAGAGSVPVEAAQGNRLQTVKSMSVVPTFNPHLKGASTSPNLNPQSTIPRDTVTGLNPRLEGPVYNVKSSYSPPTLNPRLNRPLSGGTPVSFGNCSERIVPETPPFSPAITNHPNRGGAITSGSVQTRVRQSTEPTSCVADVARVMEALGLDNDDGESVDESSIESLEEDQPLHDAVVVNRTTLPLRSQPTVPPVVPVSLSITASGGPSIGTTSSIDSLSNVAEFSSAPRKSAPAPEKPPHGSPGFPLPPSTQSIKPSGGSNPLSPLESENAMERTVQPLIQSSSSDVARSVAGLSASPPGQPKVSPSPALINVETITPTATVIQAAAPLSNKPPTKPSYKLSPPQFQPLIDQLLLAREKGLDRPLRMHVAFDLVKKDKLVYKRAGVEKFGQFAALAEAAGLVQLGGREAAAWIALHPNWFEDDPPAIQPEISSQGTVDAVLPLAGASPGISTDRIPPHLQALTSCLARMQRDGVARPLRSLVGALLGQAVYSRAGVSTFKDYVALAEAAGVVQCGGQSGHAWITLHPTLLAHGGKDPRLITTEG